MIEYGNLKTLEKAMRKSNFYYEQNQKKESMANWKAKKNNNQYDQKKKDFVPNRNSKNNKVINFSNKNFPRNKNNSPSNHNNSKGKEFANNHGNYTKNFEHKEPIKCWECNGPHYASVYRNRRKTVNNVHTIHEEMTWRISEDYAQNQRSLRESTSRISEFHGGSRRYDKPNPYNYFNRSRSYSQLYCT